jgi:hypothetical protein
MIAKCPCQHCGNPVEFEAEQSGTIATCPHCGKETLLSMPRSVYTAQNHPALAKSNPKTADAIFIAFAIALPALAYAASATGLLGDSEDVSTIIIGVLSLPLYFVPSIIGRHKKNASAIFMLNLLAGWTFIGWVAAMVWACTKD